MDFSIIVKSLTAPAVSFAAANPVIALIALIVVALLVRRKPVFFLSLFLPGVLLLGVFYVIMDASSAGVATKERLIRKGKVPRNVSGFPGPMF